MKGEKQRGLVNLLRMTDKTIKRTIEKRVEGTGVYRSQHRLLMSLGKNPECSQTELADKLEISPAAVAVSLKKLEKAGYIERQCKESDNRINHIVITEKGRQIIEVSICYFREMDEAFFADFTTEEMGQLENFLGRIIKNGEAFYSKIGEAENKGKAARECKVIK